VAEAAAVPLGFLTAWHMLVAARALRPGEDCLVIAGGSGVGSAAHPDRALLGARVIATAGSAAKLDASPHSAAHEVVNHTSEDLGARVRALNREEGRRVCSSTSAARSSSARLGHWPATAGW